MSAGGWTARDVLHHLADTELIAGVRLRRMLAEESPLLPRIDEPAPAPRSRDERAVETSVGAFEGTALANLDRLTRLRDDEWRRTARDQSGNLYSVEDWLREKTEHLHSHLADLLMAVRHPAGADTH